jgi:hypothetical protein
MRSSHSDGKRAMERGREWWQRKEDNRDTRNEGRNS